MGSDPILLLLFPTHERDSYSNTSTILLQLIVYNLYNSIVTLTSELLHLIVMRSGKGCPFIIASETLK